MNFAIAPPHESLGASDLAVVAAYFIATVLIVVASTRFKGSTDEYYLGGRRMPWFAVGLSIMATLMSTISYMSSPGEMIKHGSGYFLAYLALPFNLAFIFCLLVPFFMRLRVTSAYEYLEQRFSSPVRTVAALLFIALRLGWVAVIVYTTSTALSEISESLRPEWMSTSTFMYVLIGVVGLFSTIYTTFGGIRADIWTDVMQSIVMFAGVLFTIFYVMSTTGSTPLEWLQHSSEFGNREALPKVFDIDPMVRITIFTVIMQSFAWTICTHCSDQVVLQRYFATPDLKSARRSYLLSAFADVSAGILLAVAGLALFAFYTKFGGQIPAEYNFQTHADKVFPYFIGHQLPAGMGGLILAALLAAAMSSVDSGVNSVSAVFTVDLLRQQRPGFLARFTAAQVARYVTLIAGVITTALGILVNYWMTSVVDRSQVAIIELMQRGFNLFLGPLASLFLMGMFLPRCRTRSALLGVFSGMLAGVLWAYYPEIFQPKDKQRVPTFTLSVAFPCAVACAVGWLASWFDPKGKDHPARRFTWREIMRSTPPRNSASDESQNPR